jgi:tetratricopeptide (TPR) repeat protein
MINSTGRTQGIIVSKQKPRRGGALQPSTSQPGQKAGSDPASFQVRLQEFLQQQKYRQALEEIKKIRSQHPEIEFTPSEAEIWLLRGQQEFQKGDYKQAETFTRRSLDLGLQGEAHYWLARTLLQLDRLDAALELIQTAFQQKQLPKEYAICYLKLLLLKGETETVETLITKQAKHFSAAQLHWTRGVLALKSDQPDLALPALQKVKRRLTPGDSPEAWVVYTQQKLGHWSIARTLLGLQFPTPRDFFLNRQDQPKYLKHPIFQRLVMVQRTQPGERPLDPSELRQVDRSLQAAAVAIDVVQKIEQGNYHNAAHVLLSQDRRSIQQFPELAALRAPVLLRAGQQALEQGEPEYAETFWNLVLTEQPFDPQLAVNLRVVLHVNGSEAEEQRLLTRLIRWIEQDAKQNPQNWAGDRQPRTLAELHCYLADIWIGLGRERTAIGAVQQAERIYPQSPEVVGRKGLMAVLDDDYETATALLTQALEQGCRSGEVYVTLVDCWDELNNPQAKLETRRRFGKKFGDLNPEAEIEFAPWEEALQTVNYGFFSRLVQQEEQPDPPMRALQIFVNAAQGLTSSGDKIELNQAQSQKQWEALLKPLPGDQQVVTLKAIALAITLFAKRAKGIAALISEYQQRLVSLSGDYAAAQVAHLVVLAVKETNFQKLEAPLRLYLQSMPQPGRALAQLQLQVRKFGWIRNLIPWLVEALEREPHNPLLLLARATTYPLSLPDYEKLKQQGFELARQVQDAEALQAFREEEAFINMRQTQAMMPNSATLGSMDAEDMDQMLESLIRRMLGNKVPRAELERMLPTLKRQMMNELPDLSDFMDEDEDDFDFVFDRPSAKKRKRSFLDL